MNITDPDSHYMKTRDGFVQGYNAQAVVTEQQIVLAAEIITSTVDWSQLDLMVNAAIAELEQAGASTCPQIARLTPSTGTRSTSMRWWPTSTCRC